MRFVLLLLVIFTLQSCHLGLEDEPPYIRYTKGDLWVNKWRNNSFPSKTFVDDKIYCSSIEPGGSDSSNLLYCLNLKTGVVDWTAAVHHWAGMPPIVGDSFIYFCSYLGDIYKFDKQGNKIWEQQAESVYRGHYFNPLNNNLIIHTVTNGIYEHAFSDGAIVNHFASHSLGSSSPVFYEGYIIQAGIKDDTTVVGIGKMLRCIDYATKKSKWEYDMGEDIDKLFVNKGRVYFVSKDLRMHCIDIVAGTQLWQSKPLDRQAYFGLGDNMVFDQGKVICWGHDMSRFLVLDEETGVGGIKTSYQEVLDMHLMKPRNYKYVITTGEEQYTVRVSDSLEGPQPVYNVAVIRN